MTRVHPLLLAMASLELAVLQALTLLSNFLPGKWPHSSPSRTNSFPYSKAAWQTCKDGFVSSQSLLPSRRSGCALLKRDIEKTLDSFRERLDALQSASVFSAETKIIVSDWTLPKIAGSASSSSQRRTTQSHTPNESDGDSQPLAKKTETFLSLAQKALEEWHQQDDKFQQSAVLA